MTLNPKDLSRLQALVAYNISMLDKSMTRPELTGDDWRQLRMERMELEILQMKLEGVSRAA